MLQIDLNSLISIGNLFPFSVFSLRVWNLHWLTFTVANTFMMMSYY